MTSLTLPSSGRAYGTPLKSNISRLKEPELHQVELADPESPEAQQLLASLSATLQQITGSSGTASFDLSDVKVEKACFVIARSAEGITVGCGALRPLQPGVAELKRMFTVPGSKGVGSRVLAFLEQKAGEFGYSQIWLETRKVNEHAVTFYKRHGYCQIANFGRYVGRTEAVCLGKHLPSVQHSAAEPQQPAPPLSVKGTSCGKPPLTSNVRALMHAQPKTIEDRPSVLAQITNFFSAIAEFGTDLDTIYFVFSLFIGLGFLGYLGLVWLSHFIHNGQFLVGGIVGMVIVTISLAAILRSYIALTLALGTAAVCGVAFLSGAGHIFLP